mmetsp:Transcript_22890/g.37709  ORF Transcript_22890/g.37709 Transcript_22890/m.37709 type:complete len:122 (+) Transcript_22890:379-744(+)
MEFPPLSSSRPSAALIAPPREPCGASDIVLSMLSLLLALRQSRVKMVVRARTYTQVSYIRPENSSDNPNHLPYHHWSTYHDIIMTAYYRTEAKALAWSLCSSFATAAAEETTYIVTSISFT